MFDGLVDELELFNRILTPAEVQTIHDAGDDGKCKCLTETLHIGTGFNYAPNVNAVYNVGDLDNYWTVTCVPLTFGSNPPYPATVIAPLSSWDGPLANSQWIGPHPAAENPTNGVYCYEFKFCMTDTAGACLDLEMLVDDEATVFLNGNQIYYTGPGPNPCNPQCWFQLPAREIHTCDPVFQLVNTLRIEVENVYGVASGLNVSGSVTATGVSLEQEWCCDSSGAIAGIKWEDVDGDCVMDGNETVLEGWTMDLSGPSGPLQTQTDDFGYYFFDDLIPGAYTVAEVIPPGWEATCPPNGSEPVVVPPHAVVRDIDFGNRRKPCEPAPSGMVAWWPLDEQDGATIVEDIADAGYHPGTPSPGGAIGGVGPWSVDGKVGDALYFWQQSSDRFVRVPHHADLEFDTTDFSIDAWVKITQYSGTDIQPIVEKMDYIDTSPEYGYRFYLKSGVLSFTLAWGWGTIGTIQAPSQISQGVWHHVAVTVDRDFVNGAPVLLYIDGMFANGATYFLFDESIAHTRDLIIGGSLLGDSISYLDISIDEVEIFDRVLTDNEVLSIFEADSLGKCKAYLSGMKFHDHNGDGVKALGDGGLSNWTIFIDGYGPSPGLLDPGETYTKTGPLGNYSFTVPVPPSQYTICEVNQSMWTQTTPSPCHTVPVSENQSVIDLDFGNYGCESCTDSMIWNWSFMSGAVPGQMPSPGQTDHWTLAYGTPDVSVGNACCDSASVGMWGNKVVGEAIQQTLASPFASGWTYSIEFCASWSHLEGQPYPVQFEFRASNEPLISPTDTSCVHLGVSPPVTSEQQWIPMGPILWTATGTYSILTVSPTNQSSFNHGDSTSYGAIDRICIHQFMLGDVNGDLIINVGDVVYLVSYLYRGGPEPSPLEAGDVNCDGIVNVGDVVYLVSYLYRGGPPPEC